MQAEAGRTTERRSGTRAATTLRKLPSASAGQKATMPRARSTLGLSARERRGLRLQPVNPCGGLGCAYTSSFDGIPTGTIEMFGNALVVRLFERMIWLPTIGPSTFTLLPNSTAFVP